MVQVAARPFNETDLFHSNLPNFRRQTTDAFFNSLELDRSAYHFEPQTAIYPRKLELQEKCAFTQLDRTGVTFGRGELSFSDTVTHLQEAIRLCYADQLKIWDDFVVEATVYGPPVIAILRWLGARSMRLLFA